MRANFDIHDNVLDKVLTKNINELEFGKRTNIDQVIQSIKEVVAVFFKRGDLKNAKILLEGEVNMVSKKDLCILSFLSGGIVMINVILFLMIVMVPKIFRYSLGSSDMGEGHMGQHFWQTIQSCNP